MSKEEEKTAAVGPRRAEGWRGVKPEPLGDLCSFLFFGMAPICLMPEAFREVWKFFQMGSLGSARVSVPGSCPIAPGAALGC